MTPSDNIETYFFQLEVRLGRDGGYLSDRSLCFRGNSKA